MYVAQVFLEYNIDIVPPFDYAIAASSRKKIRYNDVKLALFKQFQDHAKHVFTSEPFHPVKSMESNNLDNSFYVISYTTTEPEDRKIKWVVKFRISDHNVQKTPLTRENLEYIRKHHANEEFVEDSIYYKDCEAVLKIRGRVKSVNSNNIKFDLNFDGDESEEIHCDSIEEVLEQIDDYAIRAYNECNQELMAQQDSLFCSSKIDYYGSIIDLEAVDLDDLVDRYLAKLHTTPVTDEYVLANHWDCISIYFEDDYQTIVLDIQDNLNNEFFIETEIDLEEYINDHEYQELLIEDLVNTTFEYYEQGGLIYV